MWCWETCRKPETLDAKDKHLEHQPAQHWYLLKRRSLHGCIGVYVFSSGCHMFLIRRHFSVRNTLSVLAQLRRLGHNLLRLNLHQFVLLNPLEVVHMGLLHKKVSWFCYSKFHTLRVCTHSALEAVGHEIISFMALAAASGKVGLVKTQAGSHLLTKPRADNNAICHPFQDSMGHPASVPQWRWSACSANWCQLVWLEEM